ncbi:MAG: helix-turn-helix transcriptional regulator [Coriobacteriia bacterium]|nr:helix-turn-helix transcriptional regulator [Coriobacteriia bacterium]
MSDLASRVKSRRLELNLTQKAIAQRSDIPLPTYRKFERTGDISLRNLVSLALTLDATEEFETLFSKRKYESIDQMLDQKKVRDRKRGRRNA